MSSVFISDLHLDESRPHTIELTLRFLRSVEHRYNTLYILGDLVEYWIGDDYCQPSLLPVFRALQDLDASGTHVILMHGNRDFLISAAFASQYNIQLVQEDEYLIDLDGQSTLLMHGDTLCTDDVDYQNFRKQVRSQQWQSDFLGKPLPERIELVEQLRQSSKAAVAEKQEYIMDVNQGAVQSALRRHGVKQIIHGHTHRPALHKEEQSGVDSARFVLGEWQDAAKIVIADSQGCKLVNWPD